MSTQVFATPIFVKYLGELKEMNCELASLILNEREEHASVKQSNLGGWQSSMTFHLKNDHPVQQFLHLINLAVGEYIEGITKVPATNLEYKWSISAWANVNDAHDLNGLHFHTGGFFSGVYFVQSPGAPAPDQNGTLFLHDPSRHSVLSRLITAPKALRAQFRSGYSAHPVPGTVVLFPSWIEHMVYPHRGPGTRISVAFDVLFEKSQAQHSPDAVRSVR